VVAAELDHVAGNHQHVTADVDVVQEGVAVGTPQDEGAWGHRENHSKPEARISMGLEGRHAGLTSIEDHGSAEDQHLATKLTARTPGCPKVSEPRVDCLHLVVECDTGRT
jgi:hypothetical protein